MLSFILGAPPACLPPKKMSNWSDWPKEESRRIYNQYGGREFFGGPPPGTREHAEWRAGREHVRQLAAKRKQTDEGVSRTPQGPRQLPGRVPPKKMPRTTAVNRLVDKSSMKIKGKRKLKKIKNIKVSRALTKKIKKVISGTEATGSYTTVKAGFVGCAWNTPSATNALPNQRVVGGLPSVGNVTYASIVGPSVNEPAGSRTLWAMLSNWDPAAGYTPLTDLIPGTDMNYFTIEKILDAASVCFNRKAISQTPWVTTNNLSTIFNVTNGLPTNTAPGPLKIKLVNSWVQFTLRNMSGRIAHLDIFECTPKHKFQTKPALQSMADTLEAGGQNVQDENFTQDATFRYYNRLADASGVQGYISGLLTEGTVDPAMIANQFGFNYKVVKRQMVLQPYETCIHSIKGPSAELDYSKMNVEQTAQVAFLKGVSVSVFMSVRVDQALPTTQSSGAKYADTAAVPAGTDVYSAQMSMPIAVEIKESYTVKVPEVAGFISAAAGQRQQLNLRKKKIVYANYLDKNGTQVFQVANEQNPQLQFDNAGNEADPQL